jgi:hypothetical protein
MYLVQRQVTLRFRLFLPHLMRVSEALDAWQAALAN